MDARDPGKRYHMAVVGAVEAATIEARLSEDRTGRETARAVVRRQPDLPSPKQKLVDTSSFPAEITAKTFSPPAFTITAWKRRRDEVRRRKEEEKAREQEADGHDGQSPQDGAGAADGAAADEGPPEYREGQLPTVYRVFEADGTQLEELNRKVNYLKLLEKEAMDREAEMKKERAGKVAERIAAAERQQKAEERERRREERAEAGSTTVGESSSETGSIAGESELEAEVGTVVHCTMEMRSTSHLIKSPCH